MGAGRSRPPAKGRGNPPIFQALARMVLILPIVAFLIAVYLTFETGDEGSASPVEDGAETPAAEMRSNPYYNLSAGLRAVNRDYGNEWSSRIQADPTDRLTFALTLKNEAPVASYPLVLWTDVEDDVEAPHGHKVRVAIAIPDGSILFHSPWIRARGWTNQFGNLWIRGGDKAVIGRVFDSSEELRKVKDEVGASPYLVPVAFRADPFEGHDHLPIGRLEGGQRVVVEFDAEWELEGKAEFGTLPPSFGVKGETEPEAFNTGSVEVGDVLHFTALLDNQGTVTMPGRLRVDFQPRRGGRYIEMRLLGTLVEEQLIGTATISSADGRPIALVPEPGSTELWSHPPGKWIYESDCLSSSPPTSKRTLPDGIALGGVEIGDFGGFNPHGECAGVEFNQQLHFEANVTAKR